MSRAQDLVTRRRVLFIGAAALGAAGLGVSAARSAPVGTWTGQALGAHCVVELVGAHDGDPVFAEVEAELRRLERIFSLYRTDSEIARLNRDGRLDAPSPEMLEVLALSAAVHRATDGLFDPTVQPLFELYARHHSAPGADPSGPPRAELARAVARIGFPAVAFDADGVRFGRAGMALTLNGVAQGFVTDRIAALLRSRGFADMLLDVGEVRALGSRSGVGGWTVRLADGSRLQVADEAVATSDRMGTTLDRAGSVGHIFHPRHGWMPGSGGPITVVAPTAAMADALSTAATLAPGAAGTFAGRMGARLA
jgi:thiamine biosynthesis lipoprotein